MIPADELLRLVASLEQLSTHVLADAVVRDGRAVVVVAVDGRVAGMVLMADSVRPDARSLVSRLRRDGVGELALATGDHPAVAAEVPRQVGVNSLYTEQTPEDKLALVATMRARPGGGSVVMVGDRVNDALALASADVGIAHRWRRGRRRPRRRPMP